MTGAEERSMFISAIGQDSHCFEAQDSVKQLVLGGVTIPGCPGLHGNSDADVLLHAWTNAVSGLSGVNILGAVSDRLCLEQGITDSRAYLLEAVKTLVNCTITHISVSIEAARPHLSAHIPAIRASIAVLFGIPAAHVGITATSGEGMTSFGRGEGIQVLAIISGDRRESAGHS
jgi:2-C-methyl-D-erythritol 2,4-cyclodiphosphate synthase